MKNRFKVIAIYVVTTFSLLLLIESCCYLALRERQQGLGFFINTTFISNKSFAVLQTNQYNQIDPLLGYEKTEDKLKSQGFTLDHGFIVLTTSPDTTNNIKILITGGSTTDISLNEHNWPVELLKLLKQHGIKATLYVAAVGGYNSGQELLSLIRDGLNVKPSVHISYSGANEVWPAYVSIYENDLFNKEFVKPHTSWLLPNTVFFLRDLLNLNHTDIDLLADKKRNADQFWERNMGMMEGAAFVNHYQFIGILQPVVNRGTYKQPPNGHDSEIKNCETIYPLLKIAANRHADFITDLTGIFDTCTGSVFIDHCHIHDDYQPIVAQNIFNTLSAKKVFEK